MDQRLSELSKVKVMENQTTSAWLTAVEQPQADSVLRTELIEVTALLVATRQISLAWLK
ncbi:MAG TPA: hypothetical protein VGO68_08825 [Pyrinomonadaceae bacterium]|jgi:hypothetical protein|nr:hypothetical protein [Pyrinomonadaceae bacterium]